MVTLRLSTGASGRVSGPHGAHPDGVLAAVPGHPVLPLHERVGAAVRRAIATGEVGPGDALPTARELADAFAVHPNTVLRAYRALRDEGTIELRAGRGAHVSRSVAGRAAGAVAGRVALREQLDTLLHEAARHGVGLRELLALVRERHGAAAGERAHRRSDACPSDGKGS